MNRLKNKKNPRLKCENVRKNNFNNNGETHQTITLTFLIQIISKCNKYCAVQYTRIVDFLLQNLHSGGHYMYNCNSSGHNVCVLVKNRKRTF